MGMGKPHERSRIAAELAELLDRLPRCKHLRRSDLRKLLGDHHGIPWQPPPPAPPGTRKHRRRIPAETQADAIDAPLPEPAAAPAPNATGDESRLPRPPPGGGETDRFGLVIDAETPPSRNGWIDAF